MALGRIVRARIILDLLKDGDVATEANYDAALLDYATAPLAIKYGDAVLEAYYGYDEAQVAAASNAEKATAVINMLRRHLRDALRQSRAPEAARAAADAETAVVNTEVDTELGVEEA